MNRKIVSMNRKIVAAAVFMAAALPLFGQKDEDKRLAASAEVLQQVLQDNSLPKSVLDKAYCVLVFPSVKKVAIGIGGSYGRGVLVCRQGSDMNGAWGDAVMYKLDQGSLGLQLGSTATDFVLAIVSKKGVDQILNGKTKLGSNASATAGPTGAQASSYNAEAMNTDVLTYSRSKGLFAGVSLEGASIEPDNDANKHLYGKDLSAKDILGSNPPPATPAAKQLVSLLDSTSPARK
jgi:lipid-binding SYLF domain-containing protein